MGGTALRWSLLALSLLVLILVPFVIYEESIRDALDGLLQSGKSRLLLAGVIALALASDVFTPVPSSLIATASGTLLGLMPGAACTWMGMQAGALLGYGVGRTAGAGAVRRLVSDSELQRAARSHRRWGGVSLIVARAVPVLAESSVVLAGTVRMEPFRFFWLTGLSNAVIAAVYAAIGAFALEAQAFLFAFLGSVLIPGAVMWASRSWTGGGTLLPGRRTPARRTDAT